MSATKKLVANQLLAFAGQLLPAAIGVLSFMLLVRVTEPFVLGQYIIYMAAVVMFEMIKSGGLQAAIVMRAAKSNSSQPQQVTGSAYYLGGLVCISISLVLALLYFSGLFSGQPGVQVFCGWYAVVGIITLPLHIAEAEAVAKQQLKFLFWLRLAQSSNALLTAAYAFFAGSNLQAFATVHLLFNLLLLLVVLAAGKTNPLAIRYRCMQEVKQLYQLIRYTIATLATTNLLKTADTFLIGSLMGPVAVAKYAVPLKLTELFEIPLRSLSTTSFPQLAAHHNNGDKPAFTKTFVEYTAWAYMIYIPALLLAFLLAPWIVLLIGGTQYADTAGIFRIFILFGLLLPANRMTGIGLDAMQLPHKNFIKVLIMASINILGDLVAIYAGGTLEWVAVVTVINALCGACIGWWLLQQTGILQGHNVFKGVGSYCSQFARKGLQKFKVLPQ
jgi:O-antigen/teichoic acid export membrane protein